MHLHTIMHAATWFKTQWLVINFSYHVAIFLDQTPQIWDFQNDKRNSRFSPLSRQFRNPSTHYHTSHASEVIFSITIGLNLVTIARILFTILCPYVQHKGLLEAAKLKPWNATWYRLTKTYNRKEKLKLTSPIFDCYQVSQVSEYGSYLKGKWNSYNHLHCLIIHKAYKFFLSPAIYRQLSLKGDV